MWHVLTKGCADRFAEPQMVARKLLKYAYTLGQANRPDDQTGAEYVRQQLDRLDMGADLTIVGWGSKIVELPPSGLKSADD